MLFQLDIDSIVGGVDRQKWEGNEAEAGLRWGKEGQKPWGDGTWSRGIQKALLVDITISYAVQSSFVVCDLLLNLDLLWY